jgi:lipoyl(octanoyl) transferase
MTSQVSTVPPGPQLITLPGLAAYRETIAAMEQQAAAIRDGTASDAVWFLEHPPVYTGGTSAKPEDLTGFDGIEIFHAGRGGQWTYHGPGQRIAYVMLDLGAPHGSVLARDIRSYVCGLETWAITALRSLGVTAQQRPGRVGLWVESAVPGRDDKIAAIGVRVSRWVSYYGIAINVAPDLAHYAGIIPCGISEHGVTSLAALGAPSRFDDLDAALIAAWPGVFGAALVP